MTKTEEMMWGREVLSIKRKLFWNAFLLVIAVVVVFTITVLLYFSSDFEVRGKFWESVTYGNIWKYVALVVAWFLCSFIFWTLCAKRKKLKNEFEKHTARSEKIPDKKIPYILS